ncbi:MAG: DNA repair protein RecO [Candidatus Muiribacteriota bacterium]
MELNCTGITINSYDLKDRHRILVVLSDDFGKIKIISKNSKGLKSSNRETSMLMSVSSYKLIRGKNFHQIRSASLLKGFKCESYENYETACELLLILNKSLPEDYVNSNIFILTKNFLTFIEKMPSDLKKFVISSFILKFLYLIGHLPNLKSCECGLQTGKKFFFDYKNSVYYCSECTENDSYIHGIEIDKKRIKILNEVLRWDYSFERADNLKDEIYSIYQLVRDYLRYHFS